jgi:hypothetical protein
VRYLHQRRHSRDPLARRPPSGLDMQAGRLHEIKPCSMNAVTLAVDHHW